MGSQTSTDKIDKDKGTGTYTQNSMCDNSNIQGGGSLLIPGDEHKLNESIESQKQEKGEDIASKTADIAIHNSKLGDGNSSIDMPSF